MTRPGIARHTTSTLSRSGSHRWCDTDRSISGRPSARKGLDGGGLLVSEMPVPDEAGAVAAAPAARRRPTTRCARRSSPGTLLPGEQLHDARAVRVAGLSRTPVRDALARLQEEGLVETAPQRFTRVTTIEESGVRDCFPVLAAVHALADRARRPARWTRDDVARAARRERRLHGGARRPATPTRALRRRPALPRRLRRAPRRTPSSTRVLRPHRAAPAAAAERCGDGDAARAAARSPSTRRSSPARRPATPRGAASATRENWLEMGALMARSMTASPATA